MKKVLIPQDYKKKKSSWIKSRTSSGLGDELIKKLKSFDGEELKSARVKEAKRLEENLRESIEKLNDYRFEDSEGRYFFNVKLKAEKNNCGGKGVLIQRNHIQTTKNNTPLLLINKSDYRKNKFQFYLSPLSNVDKNRDEFRLTLLINGIPLVHIELVKPKSNLEKALNRLKNTSCKRHKLYEYIHIYVISNGGDTRYFASFSQLSSCPNLEKTSYGTDSKHTRISELEDFSKYFFQREVIGEILTKYCTFKKDGLVVMRPYQICAVESVLNKVQKVIKEELGSRDSSGGYIGHATGSGKTLTCFKVSKLVLGLGELKVLFLVDRIALNEQAVKSFKEYGGVVVEDTCKVEELREKLYSSKKSIVVTTIHKLRDLISSEKNGERIEEKFVLFFDECHRSRPVRGFNREFEEKDLETENKDSIVDIRSFFRYHCIFGFTGTPIFESEQAGENNITTEDIFGVELHRYTIDDALADRNILRISVHVKSPPEKIKKQRDRERRKKILGRWTTQDIVSNLSNWTKRKEIDNSGFGALFTVSTRDEAIEYYRRFRRIAEKSREGYLKMGVVISEPNSDIEREKKSMQKKLVKIMSEFGGETSVKRGKGEDFRRYKEEVLGSFKEGNLDLLIVVDMLLTGFDEPQLNTLIIKRKIEQSLTIIQAFSRTNRFYNDEKTEGRVIGYGEKEEIENKVKIAKANYKGEKAIEILGDLVGIVEEEEGYITEKFVRLSELKKEIENITNAVEDEKKERYCFEFKVVKETGVFLLKVYELSGDLNVQQFIQSKEKKGKELKNFYDSLTQAQEDVSIEGKEEKWDSLPPLDLFDPKLEEKIRDSLRND